MREQRGCVCPSQAAHTWAACSDWGVGSALGEKGKGDVRYPCTLLFLEYLG